MSIWVEVTALVTYYKGEMVNAIGIADSEADAHAVYRRDLISLAELAPALVRLYGDNVEMVGRKMKEYLSGELEFIVLDGPAALLPCIGGVRVECQTTYLDWTQATERPQP